MSKRSCQCVALSRASVMVAVFVASPALAEEALPLLHLRLSVGPTATVGRRVGRPRVESSTREATGSYTTDYAGGGIALEIGPGFTLGAGTVEIFATSFEWYRVTYFNRDDEDLQRMNVQLEPRAFAFATGLGASWPFFQGSPWRFGAGFRFAFVQPHLETPDGEVSGDGGGALVVAAVGTVGPRWPILRTSPRDANAAVTLGTHARVFAGVGQSYFGSVALMADLAFQ